MFHLLRRGCYWGALQVQRFPTCQLHCRQSPTAAPSYEATLRNVLFQCLRPPMSPPSHLSVPVTSQSRKLHISPHCFKKRKPAEPEPRELDLLRYDIKSLKHSPKPALYLGVAGLIPFVSLPLFMGAVEVYYPELAFAQMAYGASILSFCGGIRWGFAIPEGSPASPDWMNLASSTAPALLAWFALLFRENLTQAIIMTIIGFGIALHYDLALLPNYPSWFKALRAILTVVAVASLLGTLLVSASYPEKVLPSLFKK